LAIFGHFWAFFDHFWAKKAIFGLFRAFSPWEKGRKSRKIDKNGVKNEQNPGSREAWK